MSEQSEMMIYKLIPKIMLEVGAIEKGSKNQAQGYRFRGIDDVMAAFHTPLAKHGVFYVPQVLESEQTDRQSAKGGTLIYTRLKVAYTFFAPDGSSVCAIVVGEAMDSGDKSSNKAMSAALKYALLQTFCVPVDSEDDADRESPQVTYNTDRPQTVSGMINPPQIAAIENLMSQKKIGAKTILDKYAHPGRKELHDLTFEQASQAIKWLGSL